MHLVLYLEGHAVGICNKIKKVLFAFSCYEMQDCSSIIGTANGLKWALILCHREIGAPVIDHLTVGLADLKMEANIFLTFYLKIFKFHLNSSL